MTVCTALFDYSCEDADYLDIKKGDKIVLLGDTKDGWLIGYLMDDNDKKEGYFPKNYVSFDENEEMKSSRPASIAHAFMAEDETADESDLDTIHTSSPKCLEKSFEKLFVSSNAGYDTSDTESDTFEVINRQRAASSPSKIDPTPYDKYFVTQWARSQIGNKEYALTKENTISYENNFWGSDGRITGFEVMLNKHRNGKKILKELVQYVSRIAACEEERIKILHKSTNVLSTFSFTGHINGDDVLSFGAMCDSLQEDLAASAEFTRTIKQDIVEPIRMFLDIKTKRRKEMEREMKHVIYKVNSTLADCKKTEREIDVLVKDIKSVNRVSKPEDDIKKIATKIEKLKSKVDKLKMSLKKQEDAYLAASDEWEQTHIIFTKEFQLHEEDRILLLKRCLENFAKAQSQLYSSKIKSLEPFFTCIQRIEPANEIETFVKEFATGCYIQQRRNFTKK